jgi:hypothetical protein
VRTVCDEWVESQNKKAIPVRYYVGRPVHPDCYGPYSSYEAAVGWMTAATKDLGWCFDEFKVYKMTLAEVKA